MNPRLNVGCGMHYLAGWWNTDVVHRPDHPTPDQLHDPFHWPWPAATFTHVRLSHVLEHVQWERVPDFLAEARRVIAPAGRVFVIGPSVSRTLDLWHRGESPRWLLESVMEHAHPGIVGDDPGRHHWNSDYARTCGAMEAAGFRVEGPYQPELANGGVFDEWEPTQPAAWQFSLLAYPT